MDFKNKYLKYKIKYLELKNQIGGQLRVESIRPHSNSIQISNLPIGTTLTHLEDFLRMQGIPIGNHGLHLNNGKGTDFLINFTDNLTAVQQHHNVTIALTHYDPNTPIPDGMGAVAKAQPPVAPMPLFPMGAVPKAQPDFTRPWENESKILYIALPIAQSSQIGTEIETRFRNMKEKSPFTNFDTRIKLTCPHISLFQLYIPSGSDLDDLLSNQEFFFDNIANTIKKLFIKTFKIDDSDSLQLHSELGDYKMLGSWIARTYVDKMYLPQVVNNNYTPFRDQLGHILLGNLQSFPLDQFTSKIKKEVKQADHYKSGSKELPFTHYSMSPNMYPKSEMAVPSYYSESWTPHISLIGNHSDPTDFITNFQNAAKKPMSFINLWSVHKIKMISEIGEQHGSLEYIYCSYGKQFIYIKI